ncbi:MAG: hypothetical protein EAZ85_00170 [Bacteroidetes bacterium]|nr:MAG: hypothetical protein EAZ85_00170 [Bacteroidota bacterium]TAG90568.1 MAG: hypothetical protein EAZ20_04075 [Bacteroidota bacterium]
MSKNLLIIFLFCLFACKGNSNHRNLDERNTKCSLISNPKQNQKNTFPFNKITHIEAIHFKLDKGFDSYKSAAEIVNDTLVLRNIVSRYTLDKKQTNKLFEALYHYKGNDVDGAKCYDPEHTFVFYEKEKAIAFFEICFGCKGTRQKNIKVDNLCEEKWSMLSGFFEDMDKKSNAKKNYKRKEFDLTKLANFENLDAIKVKSEIYQRLFGDTTKSNPNPFIEERLFSKQDRKNGLNEYIILTGGDSIYASVLAYIIYDKNDKLLTAFELARSGGDMGMNFTTKGYFENDTIYHRVQIKTAPTINKDGSINLTKILSDTIKETFILSKSGVLKKI